MSGMLFQRPLCGTIYYSLIWELEIRTYPFEIWRYAHLMWMMDLQQLVWLYCTFFLHWTSNLPRYWDPVSARSDSVKNWIDNEWVIIEMFLYLLNFSHCFPDLQVLLNLFNINMFHIVVVTKKPPMCQIMCLSFYCINRLIKGRRIN